MNLSIPNKHGNVGIIKLNRDLLNLPINELDKTSSLVDTFLKQGVLLSTDVDTARNLVIYRLSHPDFTLPNNTEYFLYLTTTPSQTTYISKLVAFNKDKLTTVKTYAL